MACADVQSKLSDYAVGLLNEHERADVERHLQRCVSCSQELEALRRTGMILDALPLEGAPAHLWESIHSRIMTEAPPRKSLWDFLLLRRLPRLAYAGMLATVVLVVALILVFSRPAPSPEDEMGDFIERHGMLAWNDPLSDKASLGALVGYSVVAKEAR